MQGVYRARDMQTQYNISRATAAEIRPGVESTYKIFIKHSSLTVSGVNYLRKEFPCSMEAEQRNARRSSPELGSLLEIIHVIMGVQVVLPSPFSLRGYHSL